MLMIAHNKFRITILLFFIVISFNNRVIAQRLPEEIKIQGSIKDIHTHKPLGAFSLGVFSNCEQIIISPNVNWDGEFTYWICSSDFMDDTIIFDIIYPGYYYERIAFNIWDDCFDILLEPDPENTITMEVFEDAHRRTQNHGGHIRTLDPPEGRFVNVPVGDSFVLVWIDDDIPPNLAKKRYQHFCTGKIKSYKEMSEEQLNTVIWEEIKNGE